MLEFPKYLLLYTTSLTLKKNHCVNNNDDGDVKTYNMLVYYPCQFSLNNLIYFPGFFFFSPWLQYPLYTENLQG